MIKKTVFLIAGILLFSFAAVRPVLADARDDFVDLLEVRQGAVIEAMDKLELRVLQMNSRDPRKAVVQEARPDLGNKSLVNYAKDRVSDFEKLMPENHAEEVMLAGPRGTDLPSGRFRASDAFEAAETAANTAINNVNRALIAPVRPGITAENEEGTVPEGDLQEDFIPQLVRLLFFFTSLGFLITLIVASVMMVVSLDNEEYHTKAKDMIIFALVGFAFIALAFALVQAVTDIDFFRIAS